MIIREARFPTDMPFLQAALGYAALGVRKAFPPGTPMDERYPIYRAALGGGGGLTLVALQKRDYAGAAWYRNYSPTQPGYAFVDEDTPELTIGVAPNFRGQGVGRSLMVALIDIARERQVPALSLDVELDNQPAINLYRSLGFHPYGAPSEVSQAMILRLGAPRFTVA